MKLNSSVTPPRRVKAAFIWPFAIVLTFVLAAFVATAYFLEVQVRDRALADRVNAVSTLVAQKLSKDTHLMQAMMGNDARSAAFHADRHWPDAGGDWFLYEPALIYIKTRPAPPRQHGEHDLGFRQAYPGSQTPRSGDESFFNVGV